jgi:putative phosphoserine phosphatase/1-acylglycerol-3-phosphate O-acyltransferase
MLEFRGQSERKLLREARDFVERMVVPTVYPEAIETLRWHQKQGHIVAIVSGATKFVVRPVAEALGIKHYLYTRLEVEHGRFTGRVIDPLCFEEGKIYWLQQFIDERGIDLAKSWFYTDSVTDLPLMDLVGHPVAVNPTVPFRAARRHWPVKFYEPPSGLSLAGLSFCHRLNADLGRAR